MNPQSRNDTIVKEITIKATAERVFEALIDPRQRAEWWGVDGRFKVTDMESDLRVGGAWSMRGVGMGGKPFTIRGEYRTIERPRLLEFTWLPDWQAGAEESLVRFDLTEKGGVTAVRVTHSGLTEAGKQHHSGWPQVLGWLRAYTESGK